MPLTNENLKAEFVKLGCQNANLHFFSSTDSTNTRAAEYLKSCENTSDVHVFIAECQTAGRGRRGRSFVSSPEVGLYMSIALPISEFFDDLTAYAAVMCAEATEELSGKDIGIKWVNDLYRGGRKLAGILCEGIISPDTGKIKYAVIGIGINVLKREFSGELSFIASDIESETGVRLSRAKLAALVYKYIAERLSLVGSSELIEKYKARSILKRGDSLTVNTPTGSYHAKFFDIDEGAALLVETEEGEMHRLTSGEVSIRREESLT